MAKTFILASKLDTAATDPLRDDILKAEGDDLVFDASGVEHLGALSLELLMSVGVLWKKAGHAVSLENPSEQMIDDLKRFGLTPDTLLESAA